MPWDCFHRPPADKARTPAPAPPAATAGGR
jgi:hypothetical protein